MLDIYNLKDIENSLKDDNVVCVRGSHSFEECVDAIESFGKIRNNSNEVPTGQSLPEPWVEIKNVESLSQYFRFSQTKQPLHTDGYHVHGIQYAFLYFEQQAPEGGETVYIDSPKLKELLIENNLFDMATSVVFTLKKECQREAPLFDKNTEKLCWNYYRIINQLKAKEKLFQFLDGPCWKQANRIKLGSGELLIFEDNQILHGREMFKGDRLVIKGFFNA